MYPPSQCTCIQAANMLNRKGTPCSCSTASVLLQPETQHKTAQYSTTLHCTVRHGLSRHGTYTTAYRAHAHLGRYLVHRQSCRTPLKCAPRYNTAKVQLQRHLRFTFNCAGSGTLARRAQELQHVAATNNFAPQTLWPTIQARS